MNNDYYLPHVIQIIGILKWFIILEFSNEEFGMQKYDFCISSLLPPWRKGCNCDLNPHPPNVDNDRITPGCCVLLCNPPPTPGTL